MTIRLRESVLTPNSGRGSSFFSGTVYLLNPYVAAPLPASLPTTPIHPIIISPLIIDYTPVELPLNECAASYYVSLEATESLAITEVNPTLIYYADRLHEVFYNTFNFKSHQVSWKSDTTQRLHDISWSFSALALHTALYESLISQEAWTLHESAWASAGGLTATFEQHDTSWASEGSLSAAFEQHDTSWTSITTSAAQTQHNTTWASVGGLTSSLNTHSTSWASSTSTWTWVQHDVHWGITSAFAFHALSYASQSPQIAYTQHDTHWSSVGSLSTAWSSHEVYWSSVGSGFTASSLHEVDWQSVDDIQALHLSFWKSIQAKHRFHQTTWAMQATNERFHEVRYRSNQTTPTLLSGSFYVRV